MISIHVRSEADSNKQKLSFRSSLTAGCAGITLKTEPEPNSSNEPGPTVILF